MRRRTARQGVNTLGERIARLIEGQGPLSIAQFMTLALHDSHAGYYATRDPFGRSGDFITAPEISQMFGELLGLWIVQAWHDQGAPGAARLVELGPGRGTLMADALRAARRAAPDFIAAIDVMLVENSPALRECSARRWPMPALPSPGARLRRQPRGPAALPARQRVLRRAADPPICEDRAGLARAHGDAGCARRTGLRAGADAGQGPRRAGRARRGRTGRRLRSRRRPAPPSPKRSPAPSPRAAAPR